MPEAHEALANGPAARAQFLAEEAIATYHEGALLSRVAKATLRHEAAQADDQKLSAELKAVEADLARVTADVDALEQRLRAARALRSPKQPDTPERLAERRATLRETLHSGSLLCSAARLLGAASVPDAPADGAAPTAPAQLKKDLLAAEASLAEAGSKVLDPAAKVVDEALDKALGARSACLSVLSRARRSSPAAAAKGASEGRSADQLLGALSSMLAAQKAGSEGMTPQRDERGVVVLMRQVFEGDALAKGAQAVLAELDRVAAAHPAFPLAIVVHTGVAVPPAAKAEWQRRASHLADAFKSVDKSRRVVVMAEDAVPVGGPKERAQSARVEIVFIAPEAL